MVKLTDVTGIGPATAKLLFSLSFCHPFYFYSCPYPYLLRSDL